MKKILRHSFHITRWTLASLIIVVSIVLLTARTFSLYIEEYAAEIADRLSIVFNVPVEVDSVSTEWRGLGPSVYLYGVRIGEGENVSSFSSVIVKPDVISSLKSWGIIWSRFEVTEMNAYLEELPSGRWAFAGIELGGGGGAYLEEMILESNRVSVQEAKLNVRSLLGTEIELNVHNVSLDYALAFHRLKLSADFGTPDNSLEFIAELTGSSARLLDLDGLAYLKIDAHNVGDLYTRISNEFLPGIDLATDEFPTAEVELWANFRAGRQIEWQGSAELDGIPANLLGFDSGAPRFIADLTGIYSTQSQLFNVQDAEIQLFSDTIELPDVQINRNLQISGSEVNYRLVLPSIKVSELLESVSDIPALVGPNLQQIIDLNPRGEIGYLQLEVPNLNFDRWHLSGQLNSVDIESYRNAPAIRNLSGYLSLNQRRGSIAVDASELSILYPNVYEHWLEHQSVQGTVSWQIDSDDQSVFVFADELSVLGEHGPVKGGFLLDIPLKPGRETGVELTLFIGIENTSAEQKNNLILSSLSQDLRAWLDAAIVAGNVPEAGFVYRGSTKRGQSARRTTQLRLNVQQGELHYADHWPNARGLDAEVWVSNSVVSGFAKSGQLLDLELSDIAVEINPISYQGNRTSLLNLESKALGASSSFLDLVRTTPLRGQLGDGLDGLDIGGSSEVNLSLQLPIRKDLERSDIDIQVQANLRNNRLLLAEQNLQIDDIRGTLTYGQQGLEGSGIRARLWGRPIELDLQEDSTEGTLAIDVQGAVDVADAIDWLDLDFLGRIEGITSVAGRIELGTRSGVADYYHFWTNMRGVSSWFPQPFTKQADKVAPLDIRVVSDGLILTSLSWDILEGTNTAIQSEPGEFLFELAQAPDSISSNPVQYARLAFQSPMPDVQQGLFTGEIRLADINVDECIDVYESEVEALSADHQSSSYGTIMGLKPDLSITTERLVFAGTDFGKVTANLGFEPGAWKLNLEADYAAGSLLAFKDRRTPLLNVDSMDLNRVQTLLAKEDSDRVDQHLLDPRSLPALEFDIASITLNGTERGAWQGTLTPTENGVLINDLQGGFQSARLSEQQASSTVFWGLDTEGYYTELGLTFEYGDIVDLFRLANIEPPMSSDSGVFYTSLNWQGAPYEFSSSNPQGIMGIEARDGSFFTNDSKVPNGLLKMIGLINVGSWVRRLRLDFNDMTAAGTPYDLIVGDFVVDGDKITTLTPVDIELSSGSMLFDGGIDLGREEVDAQLVVTLPARQNVTWIAALVAGLPAAVGVWLAGMIFDDELDSLSSVSYRVQGALDDPRVSTEKMFESTITQ